MVQIDEPLMNLWGKLSPRCSCAAAACRPRGHAAPAGRGPRHAPPARPSHGPASATQRLHGSRIGRHQPCSRCTECGSPRTSCTDRVHVRAALQQLRGAASAAQLLRGGVGLGGLPCTGRTAEGRTAVAVQSLHGRINLFRAPRSVARGVHAPAVAGSVRACVRVCVAASCRRARGGDCTLTHAGGQCPLGVRGSRAGGRSHGGALCTVEGRPARHARARVRA